MQSLPEKSVCLWEPSATIKQQANITHYRQWLTREKGLSFGSYEELWEWSVNHLEDFWASLWDYFDIQASQPYSTVLGVRTMPSAQWFPGAELNYAEHVFRHATSSRPALLFQAERQPLTEISWQELRHQVGLLANMRRDERFEKETFGSFFISRRTQHEVERVSQSINRTVEIHPLFFDVDGGLIDPPGVSRGLQMRATTLFKLRSIGLHPAIDRRMIDGNPRSSIISSRSLELSE